MAKVRQIKILSIVALVLAISAMALGFAAFSTTLNISSSATVTPNSENFKIKVYGFHGELYPGMNLNEDDLDIEKAVPQTYDTTATTSIINNTNMTISNIQANFTNKTANVLYNYIIRNEGEYDAYLDLTHIIGTDGYTLKSYNGVCTSEGEATASLVDAACKDVFFSVMVADNDMNHLSGESKYKIMPNNYIILSAQIQYVSSGIYADGNFSIAFPDIELNFSTQP